MEMDDAIGSLGGITVFGLKAVGEYHRAVGLEAYGVKTTGAETFT